MIRKYNLLSILILSASLVFSSLVYTFPVSASQNPIIVFQEGRLMKTVTEDTEENGKRFRNIKQGFKAKSTITIKDGAIKGQIKDLEDSLKTYIIDGKIDAGDPSKYEGTVTNDPETTFVAFLTEGTENGDSKLIVNLTKGDRNISYVFDGNTGKEMKQELPNVEVTSDYYESLLERNYFGGYIAVQGEANMNSGDSSFHRIRMFTDQADVEIDTGLRYAFVEGWTVEAVPGSYSEYGINYPTDGTSSFTLPWYAPYIGVQTVSVNTSSVDANDYGNYIGWNFWWSSLKSHNDDWYAPRTSTEKGYVVKALFDTSTNATGIIRPTVRQLIQYYAFDTEGWMYPEYYYSTTFPIYIN
ncbi:hypothetical protein HMPREF0322_02920 [Desulfitobacterium hafniense DP7]|uniref:Uncharacterized protein n=2 Tax=Desulfitobacterium hafniense TaxID=49338 RepID=G9XPM4_DESHA|nr:hypothetical protein HMPREF0322_02920 [Desulfitobacterium hafniense DP7]